jgi:hypothetical protein
MAGEVSKAEFEKYKAETQETLLRLSGEIEKLRKEIGGLRAQIGQRH